jgi:hypothetical protein
MDQFGGLPWGLAPELWPKCSECGKSQSLLAQLIHDPTRLDLGRDGRVLHAIGPNFGDGGIAYLFLKHTDSVPIAWFFWQCG